MNQATKSFDQQKNKEEQTYRELEKLIFQDELPPPESLFDLYPKRELNKGSYVTRFAPSPTGFMHLGGVYMALISKKFAKQTGGIYFLRIEDTDQKRKIEDAEKIIIDGLAYFDLSADEGPTQNGNEAGEYGPYRQSERKHIYQSYLKQLLKKGHIYPCFCTEEELNKLKDRQSELSVRHGYYGVWAKWRDSSNQEAIERIKQGEKFVLRLKSSGNFDKKIIFKDLIKGEIELPENDLDIVVMKSDGLPTYHFAHVVDDHLMGTTHVIRADEWVNSMPLHYELFEKLSFQKPEYGHISPINKIDENNSKRKLSKRKDPEANVNYYIKNGYPKNSIIEYLLNLANSDFEDWKTLNLDKKSYDSFNLSFEKLANSNGPLFDENKLQNISKEVISRMSSQETYLNLLDYTKAEDSYFYNLLKSEPEYWVKILNMEKDSERLRKDIAKWTEVYPYFSYFDKQNFQKVSIETLTNELNKEEVFSILNSFRNSFDSFESSEKLMDFFREMSKKFGFAVSLKEYKSNKNLYRGHVGSIAQIIRIAVTGREASPDIYTILQILGKHEVLKRITI